jgi:hypothetical protein
LPRAPPPGHHHHVSHKSAKIAALLAGLDTGGAAPHYAGYFACFNRGLFYEAHDVLEELWLPLRQSPGGDFYKGLIQFAGAFVHLQKNRLRPAAALLKLARANLAKYPSPHERLDTAALLALADDWLGRLEAAAFTRNPFDGANAPRLELLPGEG